MLFLVMGTPWKTPKSSRLCCPDFGEGWFGGTSSTRTATLRMRLRNSCGRESSVSSTTLTKCSRFILHPLKKTLARSFRIAVFVFVAIIIVIFFFAIALVFLFVLFLVWLLPHEDIGIYPRTGLAGIFAHAFVPVELLLKARLRIGSPPEGTHRNFEFSAAKCADSDCRSGAQPFEDPEAALDHEQLSPEPRFLFPSAATVGSG